MPFTFIPYVSFFIVDVGALRIDFQYPLLWAAFDSFRREWVQIFALSTIEKDA
jgi:hypothetical protein